MNTMKIRVALAWMLAGLVQAAALADVSYVRSALFSGFDGKTCKMTPAVTTDGNGTAFLTWGKLLLTGSDVFYGMSLSKSSDGGETWSPPRVVTELPDTREDGLRVTRSCGVFYNRRRNAWFGLGLTSAYENDRVPVNKAVGGRPYNRPIRAAFDPVTARFSDVSDIAFPLPYASCYPFGQTVELPDGDMLVAFDYEPLGAKRNAEGDFAVMKRIVIARCRLDDDGFRILKTGEPIACDGLRRGVGEPSLVECGGKIYLTLRSDEAGMWCESADGLNFSAPRRWSWLDGREIGNRNTQQHWMKVGGKLYLAYTRETPTNGHVFRNRAPVFLAEFDPVRGGLVRETERPIVPERGARLGNFCCTDDGHGGSWLITAEWMQPLGCEKYGSDNSLWFVRASERPAAKKGRGVLLLTFDDGHLDNWDKALPLFDRYGMHATFFVNGEPDEGKLMKMRTYQSYGHSVGLHGARHVRATPFIREKGMAAYLEAEIAPQLAAIRAAKLEVRNFAYPMSDRDEATDAALRPHFTRMRTGHLFGRDPAKTPLATCDEAFVSREQLARSPVLAGLGFGSQHPGIADDLERGLERLATRNEALVLYSHDITPTADGDSHNTSLDVLARILDKAHALGIEVIGFDDLPD